VYTPGVYVDIENHLAPGALPGTDWTTAVNPVIVPTLTQDEQGYPIFINQQNPTITVNGEVITLGTYVGFEYFNGDAQTNYIYELREWPVGEELNRAQLSETLPPDVKPVAFYYLAPNTVVPAGVTGGPKPDYGDIESPSPPTLTATTVTATSVTLLPSGGTDNVGVVGYDVYRDGVLLDFEQPITAGDSFVDDTVAAGTTYSYFAVAFDAARNYSDDGASISVTPGTTVGGVTGDPGNPDPGNPDPGNPGNPDPGNPGNPHPGNPDPGTDSDNPRHKTPGMTEDFDSNIPAYVANVMRPVVAAVPPVLQQGVADGLELIYRVASNIPAISNAFAIVQALTDLGDIDLAIIAKDKDALDDAIFAVEWDIFNAIPFVGNAAGILDSTADTIADVFNWDSLEDKKTKAEKAILQKGIGVPPFSLIYTPLTDFLYNQYIPGIEAKHGIV
jgi:hypothetical protein